MESIRKQESSLSNRDTKTDSSAVRERKKERERERVVGEEKQIQVYNNIAIFTFAETRWERLKWKQRERWRERGIYRKKER